MNKVEFLESLKMSLEENNIPTEEVLKVYEKRFEIGYEAGMSDEEIISAFDTIEQIILKYKDHGSLKTMNVNLNLLYFSDFVISNSNSKGIHLVVDEGVKQYIEIIQNDTELIIKPTDKLQSKKFNIKKYDGRLEIGTDVVFDEFKIINVSCDIQCGNIIANRVKIENVSGDINFKEVKAREQVVSNNTTGDINFKSLITPKAKTFTLSGDLKFGEIVVDNMDLNTISGDATIDYCNEDALLHISTVSGNVCFKHGAKAENVKAKSVSGHIEIK